MKNLETTLKTVLSNAHTVAGEKELIEQVAQGIQQINSQLTDYYTEDWDNVLDQAQQEVDNCTVIEDWEDLAIYAKQQGIDTDNPEDWDELDTETFEDFCNTTPIIYIEKECYYVIAWNLEDYITLD